MNIDQSTIIEQAVDYFLRYYPGKPGLIVLRQYIITRISQARNDGKLSQQMSDHWCTYRMAIETNKRLRKRRAFHASFKRRDPDRTATSIEDEIQEGIMSDRSETSERF